MPRLLLGSTSAVEMSRPLDLNALEREFSLLRAMADKLGYEGPLIDELHFALCALGVELVPRLRKMGYALYPPKEEMPKVGELARRYGLHLGGHGSYLINLASSKASLRRASKGHITALCGRMALCGALYGVIHLGYWKGLSREQAERYIVDSLEGFVDRLPIPLALENAGLFKAIGPVDFVLKIVERFDNLTLCLDFAHVHATTGGGIRTKEDAKRLLSEVVDRLGSRLIVIHVSDIEWGKAGEVRHVKFGDGDLNYQAVFEAIAEVRPENCAVICESPARDDTLLVLRQLGPIAER